MKRLFLILAVVLMAFLVMGAAPGEVGWCDWLSWALTGEGLTVVGLAAFAVVSSYAMKLPFLATWYNSLDADVKTAIYFLGILAVGAILLLLTAVSCAGDMSWEAAWWPLIQRVFAVFGAGTLFYTGPKAASEVGKRLLP